MAAMREMRERIARAPADQRAALHEEQMKLMREGMATMATLHGPAGMPAAGSMHSRMHGAMERQQMLEMRMDMMQTMMQVMMDRMAPAQAPAAAPKR